MSRLSLILGWAAPALCTLLAQGCASDENFQNYLSTGRFLHDHRKWADATHQLSLAVRERPDSYEAQLLLGNSAMEYGNDLFLQADKLARQGMSKADRIAEDANLWHDVARAQFIRLSEMDPSQTHGWFGLGRLHYQRVSSPLLYPYGPARQADEQTRKKVQKAVDERKAKETDEGIEALGKVIEKVPDARFARRYLGILLFYRAMRLMDDPSKAAAVRDDLSKGREHLLFFKDQIEMAIQAGLKRPARSDAEKKTIRDLIDSLRQEMDPIVDFLRIYHSALEAEEKETLQKPDAGDAARDRLRWLEDERRVTQEFIKKFEAQLGGP